MLRRRRFEALDEMIPELMGRIRRHNDLHENDAKGKLPSLEREAPPTGVEHGHEIRRVITTEKDVHRFRHGHRHDLYDMSAHCREDRVRAERHQVFLYEGVKRHREPHQRASFFQKERWDPEVVQSGDVLVEPPLCAIALEIILRPHAVRKVPRHEPIPDVPISLETIFGCALLAGHDQALPLYRRTRRSATRPVWAARSLEPQLLEKVVHGA
mmetsp:Transcript_72873/g.202135  ORF Transcript_72873/g.202135 Transcript_72873/m.202135 type:complete len:213 (+) Transcript_72873:881-1519(+)